MNTNSTNVLKFKVAMCTTNKLINKNKHEYMSTLIQV